MVTMEWIAHNLPLVAVAFAIALIVAFIVFRPRQRVRLTQDQAGRRPHMAHTPHRGNEGKGIASEAAAAATDVAGEILHVAAHDHLPGASGPPDDLAMLKGVGPKFAVLLNARGIIRFDQWARLTPGEVERLDTVLGPFRGRLTRDRIIEQSDYLARGDRDGFEQRFGKL
jgi:predicted flap endonuclease-1-like 5' DNA nuclease